MLENNEHVLNILDICKGNIGAISVMTLIMKNDYNNLEKVIKKLEEHKIYGSDIWVIYKDKCNQDIHLFINYLTIL